MSVNISFASLAGKLKMKCDSGINMWLYGDKDDTPIHCYTDAPVSPEPSR